MGSNLNFKNMGEAPPEGSGAGRPPGGFPLARQTSVYSLTFDEFQNTMGGLGKDFGSMNMDEFLRNIWTAEEAQVMGMVPSAFGAGGSGVAVEGGLPNGNLQRQGSLTLPRTLSTKTVDEVWKDLYKENGGVLKDGNVNVNDGAGVGSNMQQRQQTLGEMTLEEFLVRAGVVREEPQSVGRPSNTNNNNGFYGDLLGTTNNNNNGGLALGFGQQPSRSNGIPVNRINDNNTLLANQSPNLDMTMNGNRPSQQQQLQQSHHQLQQPQQHQHILPKQPAISYASPLHLTNNGHLGSPGIRGGVGGLGDTMMTDGFVQGGGVQGGGLNMVGLGGAGTAVTIASVSPANRPSSDGLGKSNGDNSSLSPVPYVFNGTLRGKRSGAVEKVVERRQRRMIKNRESAARSRARKQAYTMELEAEVAKLKEENLELQKKQVRISDKDEAEIEEMQKNQEAEMMNQQPGSKRRCLRRTQTGPW